MLPVRSLSAPQLILDLLAAGAKPRRYLDAAAVYGHGISPGAFSSALQRLEKGNRIRAIHLGKPGSRGLDTMVYSLGETRPGELRVIREALERRERVLPGRVLGELGVRYVWGLLSRTRLFVMPRGGSGREVRIGEGRGDLALPLVKPILPVYDVVIEVKNEYQSFNASADEILQSVRYGVEAKSHPVLVAAHFGPSAERICSEFGIATLHLRRQLLPISHKGCNRVKPEVEKLRPVLLGPAPYEFISSTRFYQHGLSEAAADDLAVVSDPEWLAKPGATWESNFGDIEAAVRAGTSWAIISRDIRERVKRTQERIDAENEALRAAGWTMPESF